MKMKKSTKILLCLAAVFIALGSLLTAGSMMFGFHPVRALRDGTLNFPIFETRTSDVSSDGRYAITADGIQNLSVDWLAGNITIESYDGNEIVLEERSSAPLNQDNSLDYTLDENELEISYCSPKVGFYFGNAGLDLRKDLVIRIPASLSLNEISVQSASSDISVQGLTAQGLETDTVSGALSLTQATLGQLSFDSTSGNITLTDVSVQELDMNAVTGNLTGTLTTCPQKLSFDTTSGDIALSLPSDSQFCVSMDSATGKLNSHFEGTYQGSIYTVGSGAGQFEIDSVSGSVELSKNEST